MDDTDMTDEQLQQLTQLGIIPDKQKTLENQMKIAQALRYQQSPGMSGNWGSRVQTAASPLAMIAHMAQQYQGGQQMKQNQAKQDALLDQQAKGRFMMAKLLNGRNRGLGGLPGALAGQDQDPGDVQAVLPSE